MRILANRFVADGPHWIDLATASRVGVRLVESGSRHAQLEWTDRCERQLQLRHPLLNPLLDFGAADAVRVFESYEVMPPILGGGSAGVRLVRHGVRFLSAHSIALTRDIATIAVRHVALGPSLRGRPLGIVLQRRPVLERLHEVLEAGSPHGLCMVAVCSPPGSGSATLRLAIARMARLAGYVPVCAASILRYPELVVYMRERHVAALIGTNDTTPARDALAGVMTVLGSTSGRRHLVVSVRHGGQADCGELPVERLGAAAMNAMIFRDRDDGPTAAEIAEGIRAANGLPGLLVRHLRGVGPGSGSGAMLVHETAPAYGPAHEGTPARRRIGRALARAEERGRQLASAGRHAAAIRLLTRAARVLDARCDRQASARCRVRLGWILRDRGRFAGAREQFDAAALLSPDGPSGIVAAIGLGVLDADDGAYAASESRLRSAIAAARVSGLDTLGAQGSVALARTLLSVDRPAEALALLTDVHSRESGAAHTALLSRVYAAVGDVRRALEAAGRAVAAADSGGDVRDRLRAARAMAEARVAAGDRTGARDVLREATTLTGAGRYPLSLLRLRALLLPVAPAGHAASLHRRLRSAMERLQLPQRLRADLDLACAPAAAPSVAEVSSGRAALALREFLETAHAAVDDRAAGEAICQRLLSLLAAATVQVVSADPARTIIVGAGRPSQGPEPIVVRVLAGGPAVAPSNGTDAYCAAEAVRYGPDVIAALVCRWTPGSLPDSGFACALLGAGALAVAPTVRTLLDRSAQPPLDAPWNDLLGTSSGAAALRDAIVRAARAPFPVLIEGESGSGKELVARAIHRLGARRDRRLCTVNCAAITEDLLEAELFGHARGAFTGAHAERAGLFEEADGGTLFLDEVGELTPRAQAKLLRVLQDGEVRRVGENLPRRVDTRVIAATNRPLQDEVAAHRFRGDLRFRLDVVRIAVPPLRDRPGDIPVLAAHFWADAAARVGSRATLAPETLGALARYDWPGNVRELQNAMAAIAVQAPRRGRVTPALLPAALARAAVPADTTFEAAREDFERRFVRAALARAGGHRGRAARALGMTRQGFSKMLRRLQMDA